MLDTSCTVTVYGENAEAAIDEAFDLGVDYENMLSATVEGSDVYRVNHAEGQPVEVSDDTILVLDAANHYSQLSGGTF